MNVFGFNFAILCALRVLLGIFEAVSQPTFLLLSSMWYKREEQAHIVAYWYVSISKLILLQYETALTVSREW
jgi:MFS family permease